MRGCEVAAAGYTQYAIAVAKNFRDDAYLYRFWEGATVAAEEAVAGTRATKHDEKFLYRGLLSRSSLGCMVYCTHNLNTYMRTGWFVPQIRLHTGSGS